MIYTENDVVTDIRENMRGGHGKIKLEHMLSGGALPPNTRLCAKITIAPGDSLGEHPHVGETEIYIFIEGKGKVTDDGMTISVKPGYVMTTGSGHTHSVLNDGDEDLVFLALIITE